MWGRPDRKQVDSLGYTSGVCVAGGMPGASVLALEAMGKDEHIFQACVIQAIKIMGSEVVGVSKREIRIPGRVGWLHQVALGTVVRLVIGIGDLPWNQAGYFVFRKITGLKA